MGSARRRARRSRRPRGRDRTRPTRRGARAAGRHDRLGTPRRGHRGRPHDASCSTGSSRTSSPTGVLRRARDRVHRVPRHAALPAGAPRRARDRRQPSRAARRQHRRGRARADQEPVAGAAVGLSRSASCWRPTPPRRASRSSATATCSRTPRSRGTRTGSSSATAASIATARRRPRCSSITSSARAGRPAQRGSLEGDLDFLARVVTQGRADPRGPRQRRSGDRRADRGGDARPAHDARRLAPRRRGRCLACAARAGAPDARAARGAARRAAREPHDAAPGAQSGSSAWSDGARARASAGARRRRRAGHLGRPGADGELVARDDRTRAPGAPDAAPPDHLRPRARARAHRRRARTSRPSARPAGARAACAPRSGEPATTCIASRCATPHPSLGAPVAVAHGRLVITGATGHRLHEQVIFAGVRLDRRSPGTARRRGDGHRARGCHATPRSPARCATGWSHACSSTPISCAPRCRRAPATARASCRHARQPRRAGAAARRRRRSTELEATIRREAFGEHGDQLQLITGLELDAGDRRQVERDVAALQRPARRDPGARSRPSRARSPGATPTRLTACSPRRSRCWSRKGCGL